MWAPRAMGRCGWLVFLHCRWRNRIVRIVVLDFRGRARRPSRGFSAAIQNTGGNAGGLLAPFVTPLLSKYFGWQAGLGLAGIFCIAGATLWYWIDPDEQSE